MVSFGIRRPPTVRPTDMKTHNLRVMLLVLLSLPFASVAQTNRTTIGEKLQRIRFPCVEFHDANAIDVADYLMDITDPNPPFRTSIILDLNNPDDTRQEQGKTDQRKVFYRDLPRVTVTLTNATGLEVLQSLTMAADLKYEITNNGVIIKGPDGRDLKKDKWAN